MYKSFSPPPTTTLRTPTTPTTDIITWPAGLRPQVKRCCCPSPRRRKKSYTSQFFLCKAKRGASPSALKKYGFSVWIEFVAPAQSVSQSIRSTIEEEGRRQHNLPGRTKEEAVLVFRCRYQQQRRQLQSPFFRRQHSPEEREGEKIFNCPIWSARGTFMLLSLKTQKSDGALVFALCKNRVDSGLRNIRYCCCCYYIYKSKL